ncbi:hypothetical protein [Niabella hibiscisoli]|uniref:hypothetical protein n=1 Tax=Niabella hibiscisoli TaxID=1825928 RepID=UPI001F0F4608|nr:hypothetical protein [Niabella hibiscisoli]MCH5720252.1 hypothetical protein [Niabella hibiscisoli]
MLQSILNRLFKVTAISKISVFETSKTIAGKCMMVATIFGSGSVVYAQKPKPPKPILPVVVERGKIVYNADTVTGDRVPDFSYCGYKASEEDIPTVPVKVVVPLVKGDATATIQNALDKIAAMSPEANGFRGVVLLSKGNYEVAGQLKITASGIVLRGFGAQGQTIITGKGVDRDGLVRFLEKMIRK